MPEEPQKKTKKRTTKKVAAKKKKKSHQKVVLRGPTGNVKDKIDRDLFHEYLWKWSDPRSHKVTVPQTQLAEKLGVTVFTMTRIFSEMLLGGRLKRSRGVYYVVDPDVWKWQHTSTEIPWQ